MRTIAERLAYNRLHQKELNPKLFGDDERLIPEVRDLLLKIAELFLEYTQVPNLKVYDIRLVGSNASYNYNEYSDVDIHIVTDLSKIADPESIARLLFDSVKKNFKDSYDITIKGHDAELYIEDINSSPVSKGIYSITKDDWIKFPEESKDPTSMEYAEAENIEEDWIDRLDKAEDEDEIEKIIDEIYLARKDGLAKNGETDPHNLAFKSLRNKGILERSKDDAQEKISKKLSLESKEIKEATKSPELTDIIPDGHGDYHVTQYDARAIEQGGAIFKSERRAIIYAKELTKSPRLPEYITSIDVFNDRTTTTVFMIVKEDGVWKEDKYFRKNLGK